VTLFILIAAILAVLAVALVAWPLFRPQPDSEGKPVGASRRAAVAMALIVPAAAFALYFTLSDWSWDPEVQAQAKDHGMSGSTSLAQVASQLEERLQREKGDAEGWKLLGRTYVVMGDFASALKAYNQAYTLTSGTDAEALLGYAEARVLVNDSDFEGEAGELFERAVRATPNDPKALWYSGLTAYRRQDLATARARWSTLRDLGAPPEIMQILDTRIAEIDQAVGPATATAGSMPPKVAATPATVPVPAAGEEVTATTDGIPLRIEVAPGMASKVPAGMTLFVLARSGEGGGPPLAAVRRSSSELPFDMQLTDANAMIPGTSLKQVDSLTLVARVSLTGRPVPSSGDLYGELRYDPAAKGRIKLIIDKVVP
jgi:cytochrome c-type biogenesis protein CcmH